VTFVLWPGRGSGLCCDRAGGFRGESPRLATPVEFITSSVPRFRGLRDCRCKPSRRWARTMPKVGTLPLT
jgi:hypothetical protein